MEKRSFNDILDVKMGPEEIDETDAFLNILVDRTTRDMSTETLLRILPNLTDILSDIGHFEQKITYMNDGADVKSSGMLLQFANRAKDKFDKESEKIFIHRSKQISYQYDFESRDFERSELLANIAYLANTIAHRIEHCIRKQRFDKSDDDYFKEKCRNSGLPEHTMSDLQQAFYSLKNDCIKELLECQKNGENVKITSFYDRKARTKAAYVCLPGYFEPFVFHYSEREVKGIPEVQVCPFKDKTTFNFKVTPEQREIFEWLGDNYWGLNRSRIDWYLQNQSEFEGPQLSDSTGETEELQQNKPFQQDNKQMSNGKTTKWKSNEEFIQMAQEKIGITFNQEQKEQLLNRTASINFDKIYARIKAEICENLKGMEIKPEDMDVEALKCLLWLKLSYGLSGINNGTVNGNELTDRIVDSVLTYQDAFDYLQKNPNATIKEIKEQVNNGSKNSTEQDKKHENTEKNKEKEPQIEHSINVSDESYAVIATLLQQRLEETDKKLQEAQELMEEAKRKEQEAKAERDALVKTLQELGILPREEGVKNI